MGQTHELALAERFYDRKMPGLGKQYHLVCACGKQWPWRDTPEEAQADADVRHGTVA